jgi:hypothetical protein
MNISNNAWHMLAAVKSINGNQIPSNPVSNTSATDRTSSSIKELEAYFDQKLSILKADKQDTANMEGLRDKIRQAAANSNDEGSPSLPLVVKYPNGGSILTNVHVSFGTNITGELQNFNDIFQSQLKSFN